MRIIFGFLAAAAAVYSVLIFIRILFSWFGDFVSGKPVEIIKKITDPYIDWWRNIVKLRIGFLDFSVVVAIVFLSLMQNIFISLSMSERMTFGFILAEIISSIWMIISFILLFFIIIIILRLIAFTTNRNIYSIFWSIIDSISKPILYRMNRIIYGNKVGKFLNGMIISLIILVIILLGGRFLISLLTNLLTNTPQADVS